MRNQPTVRTFNHTGLQQFLDERRLVGARCSACGSILLPPRPMCPRCYGTEMEWIDLSGEGWLEGFTVIAVGLPAMKAEGYERQSPYCSGVVRLEEGPVVTAQILGGDGALPDPVQVGMPLRAVFVERGEPRRIFLAFTTQGNNAL